MLTARSIPNTLFFLSSGELSPHILGFESQRRCGEASRHVSALILKFPLSIPFVSCPREFATLETIVGEPAKKESVITEAVEQKSTMLTAQVLWACHAWNATPEEAARQVVADLYEHLSRGGTVSVRVEGLDGTTRTLEVTART
jgi:hypothetical protein